MAAARTDSGGKWVMVGILPMFDPPPDSKETIARAKEYGVTENVRRRHYVAAHANMPTMWPNCCADLSLGYSFSARRDTPTTALL